MSPDLVIWVTRHLALFNQVMSANIKVECSVCAVSFQKMTGKSINIQKLASYGHCGGTGIPVIFGLGTYRVHARRVNFEKS